jgi:thiamine pyrophosphate-dependent acetolactate synthase large subunit-like protein
MQDANFAVHIKSNCLHAPFLPSLILARLPNTARALSLSSASPFLLALPLSTERRPTFEREVIGCVGDGSYMFGNPVPAHFVARTENLPTLTVVANNHSWLAVRQSTLAVYPDGAASKANVMLIQDLNPSPAFEKVIETCGGVGEKVEAPEDLAPALKRSFGHAGAGQCVSAGHQIGALTAA